MNKPGKLTALAVSAVAVAAMGGTAAFASNHHTAPTTGVHQPAPAAGSAADTDNIQQGDLTTPDTATSGSENPPENAAADTDNIQQGDQTTPDTATTGSDNGGASETAGETAGEETAPADGPGGHQDPADNVDHQGGANEQ